MSFVVELPREKYRADAFDAFSPTNGYSHGTARATAWLSQLVYESDDAKIASILGDWGLTSLRRLDELSAFRIMARTKCQILSGRGALFIAFGGTDPLSIQNWLTDFSIPIRDDVHAGFSAAAELVWPEVSAAFEDSRKRSAPVFVAGHSLGAALAAVTARRLHATFDAAVDGVYTFGMPRTGDEEFAADYNRALGIRTFRLVHGRDVVPAVPLTLPLHRFRHVGRILRCARFGKFEGAPSAELTSNEPVLAWTACSASLEGLRNMAQAGGFFDPEARALGLTYDWLPAEIGDHLPDRYLHALSP